MTLHIPDWMMTLFYVTPELTILVVLGYVLRKEMKMAQAWWNGGILIVLVLAWAGCFDDTWRLLSAGYSFLFNK